MLDHFDGPSSTARCGSRTTCRSGARERRAPRPTRSPARSCGCRIPPEQGLWCPDDHEPAAGLGHPVRRLLGRGRQHGRPAAVPRRRRVREFQPAQWGWTPELRAPRGPRADGADPALDGRRSGWSASRTSPRAAARSASSRSSATRSRRRRRPTAAVGMGVHPFRDPALTDDFAAPRLAIDVTEFHVYAADWRPGPRGLPRRRRPREDRHQAPDYPMQMMVAVFDFPDEGRAAPRRTTSRFWPWTTCAERAPTGRSRSPPSSRTRRCRRRSRRSPSRRTARPTAAPTPPSARVPPPSRITCDPASSGTIRIVGNGEVSSSAGSAAMTVPSGSAVTADFRCSTRVSGTGTTVEAARRQCRRSWRMPSALVRPPRPT